MPAWPQHLVNAEPQAAARLLHLVGAGRHARPKPDQGERTSNAGWALRKRDGSRRRDVIPIEVQRERGDFFRSWRVAGCLFAAALPMLSSQSCRATDAMIDTKQGTLKVETVADGLQYPWSLAFLPDGRMLVTEKPGRLRIVAKDGTVSEPLKGVPEVVADEQGGLLDVALDPNFASNGLVYLSYSEPGDDGNAGTAVARGKLGEMGLDNVEVIFMQKPKVDGGLHFGSRLGL